MKIHTIDLEFLGYSKTIAAYLVETSDGPVLMESGPHSTFQNLKSGVEKVGFRLEDIKHVFLTHIHFDHAGAAWALAEMGAQIYVHPFGLPHMASPQKLYESARRIYGKDMDKLWGSMNSIPEGQLTSISDGQSITIGDTVFEGFHTPGHASHHIAWVVGDVVFTGDVAGVKIDDGPVVAPCPPPDIDVEQWEESIRFLERLDPDAMYLTHFGKVTDVQLHLQALRANLVEIAAWVRMHWEKDEPIDQITMQFDRNALDSLRMLGLNETQIKRYQGANPGWMSVAGLIRYFKVSNRKAESE